MSNTSPTALDALMIKIVSGQGTIVLPVRPVLNLADPRFLVVDNPNNPAGPSTDVTLVPSVSPFISVAAGGTITLTALQYGYELLEFSGTLPNNTTIVLPSLQGRTWVLDATAVTLSGHTLTIQANSVNWSTLLSTALVARVTFNGTKLYGSTLTP